MRPVWSSPSRGGETPAVYALLAAIGILFLIDFYANGVLAPKIVWPIDRTWLLSLQLWRPLSFPFEHARSFWYLITDGIILYFIGGSLERAWGSGRFLFFFFASGIVPGLIVLVLSPAFGGSLFYGMVGSSMSLVVAF